MYYPKTLGLVVEINICCYFPAGVDGFPCKTWKPTITVREIGEISVSSSTFGTKSHLGHGNWWNFSICHLFSLKISMNPVSALEICKILEISKSVSFYTKSILILRVHSYIYWTILFKMLCLACKYCTYNVFPFNLMYILVLCIQCKKFLLKSSTLYIYLFSYQPHFSQTTWRCIVQ